MTIDLIDVAGDLDETSAQWTLPESVQEADVCAGGSCDGATQLSDIDTDGVYSVQLRSTIGDCFVDASIRVLPCFCADVVAPRIEQVGALCDESPMSISLLQAEEGSPQFDFTSLLWQLPTGAEQAVQNGDRIENVDTAGVYSATIRTSGEQSCWTEVSTTVEPCHCAGIPSPSIDIVELTSIDELRGSVTWAFARERLHDQGMVATASFMTAGALVVALGGGA